MKRGRKKRMKNDEEAYDETDDGKKETTYTCCLTAKRAISLSGVGVVAWLAAALATELGMNG